MKRYTKLLVVIDPNLETQPALDRALELARFTGASITLFSSIFEYSYELTSILSGEERESMRSAVVNDHKQWLQQLVQDIDFDFNIEVQWHNRPFEAIIEYGINHGCDLIVKATHKHDKLKSVIFTPTDWHLLRKSPMAVLLVKEHDWPVGGKVIAAVNVGNEDEAHYKLNHKIVDTGMALARDLQGELTLVNAHPGTPVNIAIELPDFDPHAYNESIKQMHIEKIHALASAHALPNEQTVVLEGLPEDVIPEYATKVDAELVVLGTVGRTGISAALIGNTAEHVIDGLNCDLLALKPDDYLSPLDNSEL